MPAPIDDLKYRSGVNVVDIGDLRVSRGRTRRPASVCTHRRMAYDPQERRIWCKDCEQEVESFDAFVLLVEEYDSAAKRLEARLERVEAAETFTARGLAAREMDKAWRSRTMVPACPHCNHGLFPEDFRNGPAMVGKDYALARRRRR